LKIRAVLFDLGGTLLVMRRDRIFQRVLSERGKEVSLEKVHAAYMELDPWWLSKYGVMRMTREETYEAYRDLDGRVYARLFPQAGRTETDEVSRIVRSRWPSLGLEIPPELYPDAEPTLSSLSSKGFLLGLVSNAPADTIDTVKSLGLGKFLSSIVISGIVGFTKPHPEIFRIALSELGVSPNEAVHIGDLYDADVVGARNAGIVGVLLDRDHTHGTPDCLWIRSLSEIEPQVLGL